MGQVIVLCDMTFSAPVSLSVNMEVTVNDKVFTEKDLYDMYHVTPTSIM